MWTERVWNRTPSNLSIWHSFFLPFLCALWLTSSINSQKHGVVSVSEISQQLPLTVSGNCYVTSASEIPCNKANTLQITAVVNPACYLELSYFELPAISNSSFFPYTSNQTCQKQSTRVHSTNKEWDPSSNRNSFTLHFAVEGAEIRGQTSQLSFNKSIRKKKQKHRTFKGFSIQQHLPIYRHIITVFLFSLCLSSYCTVFY